MKNDILFKEYKKIAKQPERFTGVREHVLELVDFYAKNALATNKESVLEIVKKISVFDYFEYFLKKQSKKVLKKTEEIGKPNNVEKENDIKVLLTNNMRNPRMLILKDTTEKLVIKNPPFKKHEWVYKDLRSTPTCFNVSRIGDIVYRIYIDGQKSYYYMVNSPTNLEKLGIRNTYLRMFEYGTYRLCDVRLEVMNRCVYEKNSAVKYEKI